MSGVTGAGVAVSAAGTIAQGASSGKKGGDSATPGTSVLPPILDANQYFSEKDLKAAARTADPMMKERRRYIRQLRRLMRKPENIFNDPTFKARLKAGQDTVTSSAAARGLLGSGNIAAELQAEGQRIGSEEMDKQFQRLALLSGATTGSPGEAAGILSGKYVPGQLFSPTVVQHGDPTAPGGPDYGAIGQGIGGLSGLFNQSPGGTTTGNVAPQSTTPK